MATISEVKSGLESMATSIRTERQAVTTANQRLIDAKSNLQALTTVHAETIAEIEGYEGLAPFEALSKDELEMLTSEYTELIGTL